MGLFSDEEPSGVLSPKETRKILKERSGGRGKDERGFLALIRSKNLLVLVIVAMLAYNGYLYFTKDQKIADQGAHQFFDQTLAPQPNASIAKTPQNLPLFYTPDEIYEDYLMKRDGSIAKYNGNYMKVAGNLFASGSDENGQFVVLTEARAGKVYCYLASDQENLKDFTGLKPKSRVRARGLCHGQAVANDPTIVLFSDCTLIKTN